MSKVKVYQYTVWDQLKGVSVKRRHMATRHFIELSEGTADVTTEREIDESLIDSAGQADIEIQPLS